MVKIVDDNLLSEIRRLPCCWCGKAGPSEPHHIFAKGFGGGGRLDIRRNLAPLCASCHRSHHDGNLPLRDDLLALVAAREGCLQTDIEEEVWRLRRQPKGEAS